MQLRPLNTSNFQDEDENFLLLVILLTQAIALSIITDVQDTNTKKQSWCHSGIANSQEIWNQSVLEAASATLYGGHSVFTQFMASSLLPLSDMIQELTHSSTEEPVM